MKSVSGHTPLARIRLHFARTQWKVCVNDSRPECRFPKTILDLLAKSTEESRTNCCRPHRVLMGKPRPEGARTRLESRGQVCHHDHARVVGIPLDLYKASISSHDQVTFLFLQAHHRQSPAHSFFLFPHSSWLNGLPCLLSLPVSCQFLVDKLTSPTFPPRRPRLFPRLLKTIPMMFSGFKKMEKVQPIL